MRKILNVKEKGLLGLIDTALTNRKPCKDWLDLLSTLYFLYTGLKKTTTQ